jgi:hypothetical protein
MTSKIDQKISISSSESVSSAFEQKKDELKKDKQLI